MKFKVFACLVIFFFVLTALIFFPSFVEEEQTLNEDSVAVIADNEPLADKIKHILDNEQLSSAIVGVTVKHAQSGDLLFSHNGETRLHPASNMKLLTGMAALETLGTDFRFQTEILTDGQLDGNTLQGNLYVRGKGDPTLLKADFEQIAKELKAQGIEVITGDLIGDDTWYDNVRLSQDLNWSDEPFHTGAQISALTFAPYEDYDSGTVIVEVTSVDGNAHIRTIPDTDYVTTLNKTETGETKDISVERKHGTNMIIVEGKIPKDDSISRSWVSVWEPTGYALAVFRDTLVEQGIQFASDSHNIIEATPDSAQLLVTKKSSPLSEILIPFMKLSNNGIAEVLTKEMGKQVYMEGSWDKGLEVIEDVVEAFGVERNEILLRDGSGMSHKTLISSNNIAQLLYVVQGESWFNAFKYSLPVAGEEDRFVGGTLRHRLTSAPAKGNVTAKTGLITGVSTLSGYVKSKDEEELIFSFLINNHLGSNKEMQEIQDDLVRLLAEEKVY